MNRMLFRRIVIGLSALLLLENNAISTPLAHQLSPQHVQLLAKHMPAQGSHAYVPGYLPNGFKFDHFQVELAPELRYSIRYARWVLAPNGRGEYQVDVNLNINYSGWENNHTAWYFDTHSISNKDCNKPYEQMKTFQSRVLGSVKACVNVSRPQQPYWTITGGTKDFHIMATETSYAALEMIIANIIELK